MFLKNLTYLSAFTFLIIFSWVAFGIYNNYTVSKINEGTKVLITPIPASFDLEVVKTIQSRAVVASNLDEARIVSPSAQISPSPTSVLPPPASGSPNILPSPIASPSQATGSASQL